MPAHSAALGCPGLVQCLLASWTAHPMRTLALSGALVLVFFTVSSLTLLRSLLSQNTQPLVRSIELEYPDDKRILLDEHLSNETSRAALEWSLPLKTQGRHIVGANGKKVRLSSVNWYGASDADEVPGGLNVQHRDIIAQTIIRLGFNSVRLPYSDQMVRDNRIIDQHFISANPDLEGMHALDIYVAVVKSLTSAGIAVIINNHITESRWCCDIKPCDLMWSNSVFGRLCKVQQSDGDWRARWTSVMRRLIDDPLVIGADLRNEPRGLFGMSGWKRWVAAAERCANELHALNPDWLIFVEGIGSSNHLSRVRAHPVRLAVKKKLVYSAHVYGWSGWGSGKPYWTRSYEEFACDMRHNWAFLLEEDIAPVWIGEFGAPFRPNKGDAHYWQNLMRFLRSAGRPDFAYWALNPRKSDGHRESYSVVHEDWITPRRDYRMYDMLTLMEPPAVGEEHDL